MRRGAKNFMKKKRKSKKKKSMKNKPIYTCAIYCRVSKEEQLSQIDDK